ncbi:hypothetical protein [Melittangium boletus]|uniref:Lipoprotein n=1 Tax=Melittangium boletus DSM 14713 TaxID=1294270 RepID=A0A250IDA2_9BACT|nr:hypothetical protein [Melittangium boletus]ATB29203.1 hypothetical protein MEBOL_002652 [Melittangium boletus DSM 14713]
MAIRTSETPLRKTRQLKQCFALVWLVFLVGCGTTSKLVRLDTGEAPPQVFTPLSRFKSVELKAHEFKGAIAKQARETRAAISPPSPPQDAARHLFEVAARAGTFEYNARTHRLSMLRPGDTLEAEPTKVEAELTGAYRRWCEHTGASGDCLHLLEETPTLDGDGRYTLAMALAQRVVLDEMLEAFKDMADPHAMVSAILWTCSTYMFLITVPEPVTKGLAAVMTATLIAYVGVDTFWGLIQGFKRLMLEADHATTFNDLREAGERYGRVIGRDAARAFAMLAAVAVGNTAAGFAAKAPGLPGHTAASLVAETQGGFRLSAIADIRSVAVSAEGITIALATDAVATTSQGIRDVGQEDETTKPLDATSLIVDENVMIALNKQSAGRTLQPGEQELLNELRRFNTADLRVSETIHHKGSSTLKRFDITVERGSDEYKEVLRVLEDFNVGRTKGSEDRQIVADVFFAKTTPGVKPVLVTQDKGIYNRLSFMAGHNPAKLGKTVPKAFPRGFEVTVNGRTITVLPLSGS